MVVYPMGGTAGGERCDHVLLAPPFIISASVVDRLGDAIDAAVGY